MSLSKQGARVTLDVYLRSAVTGVVEARQDEVLDRIQQLNRRGTVGGVTVHYWSRQANAPNDGARNDSGCPDIVQELYDVTEENELSLEPFFRERPGDDDHRTILFLPVVCLVVRCDGAIAGVYPATRDDTHQSIQDGLGALAEGHEWDNLA